jgi:hypothetical protein
MSRRHNSTKNFESISHAARCAVEALEQRVHLSYDDRGKISVLVDQEVAPFLITELAQYRQDLIGDGFTVSLHTDAPRMNDDLNVWDNTADPPEAVESTTTQYRNDLQAVKNMIAADAEDETLTAIVLVGHVTVPYSGGADEISYDGHPPRAMPTDQYYADLDATPLSWGDSDVNVTYSTADVRGEDYIEENGDDFGGVTIDDDDIVMKYTWYGDADLDGEVNFDDYGRIDASINQSTGDEWFEGDFNYDNVVAFDDYALIDLGFNKQTGPLFFGGQSAWQQIAQMTHFSTPYMYFLIDEMEKHDIYLTEADFLPG